MKTYGLVYPLGSGNPTEVVVFAEDRVPDLSDFPFWISLTKDLPVDYLKRNTPRIVRVYPIVAEYVATEYYVKHNNS